MSSTRKQVRTLSLRDYSSDDSDRKTREAFVTNLFDGFKEHGFIILKDHPVSTELLNQAYRLSEKLFALSEEAKLKYFLRGQGGKRGYTPFGREHAKYSNLPDLKEFWHVGRHHNVWPEEIPSFQITFETLFRELDQVGRTILKALTPSLRVAEDYFDQMTERGSSILRLLHYPPIPIGTNPECVRAAAHEDINLITILVSASTSGLELKDRDGEWLSVESEPLELVVDSGDMLARITNEVIPSTTHRVVNPKGPNVSRYSMPFFMHPNPDALLSCIESCRGAKALYPDILADDFLQQRLEAIGLK